MSIIIATVLTAALGSAKIPPVSACVIQFANGSEHSSIAQHFAVALEEEVHDESSLRFAEANGTFDIKFYLVGAPANNIGAYPTDDGFKVFYVLTRHDEKFISADVMSCNGNGAECAASAVRRLVETCARRPNVSFKPNSLRESA